MPRLVGRYRINKQNITYLKDIMNKNIIRFVSRNRLKRRIVPVLTAMLTLFQPAGAATDAGVKPPPHMDMTVTGASGDENGAAAQPAPDAAHAMRFITFGRVTFVSDKWQLSDAAKRTLDEVSAYLIAHPGAERLLLEGHTDSIGGRAFNDALSDKRAMAVQDYLVNKGVDPKLIHWKGHGERAPVDENWTPLGRDRNRQVELYAVYLPE
jgi:outer membrane protein OmpA-like peptidoglycan-associated protein